LRWAARLTLAAAVLGGGTAAADSLKATIHKSDAEARRVDVIRGVGHALRVESFEVGPACEIKVEGASAPLRALQPGQIVELRFSRFDGRNVAEVIETSREAGDEKRGSRTGRSWRSWSSPRAQAT
jgi:hypothetical protein